MKSHLDTLRDFIERATHWKEGGADRHAALKVALPALEHNVRVLTDALWKACGDDKAVVEAIIESQGELL